MKKTYMTPEIEVVAIPTIQLMITSPAETIETPLDEGTIVDFKDLI